MVDYLEILFLQEERRNEVISMRAEELAEKLSGCTSEDEMKAIMNAHDEELRRLEHNLAAEKEQQMKNLKERLQRKRQEREAALRKKQMKEVLSCVILNSCAN